MRREASFSGVDHRCAESHPTGNTAPMRCEKKRTALYPLSAIFLALSACTSLDGRRSYSLEPMQGQDVNRLSLSWRDPLLRWVSPSACRPDLLLRRERVHHPYRKMTVSKKPQRNEDNGTDFPNYSTASPRNR